MWKCVSKNFIVLYLKTTHQCLCLCLSRNSSYMCGMILTKHGMNIPYGPDWWQKIVVSFYFLLWLPQPFLVFLYGLSVAQTFTNRKIPLINVGSVQTQINTHQHPPPPPNHPQIEFKKIEHYRVTTSPEAGQVATEPVTSSRCGNVR